MGSTVVKVASQLLIPLASGDLITDQLAHQRLQGVNFLLSQLFSNAATQTSSVGSTGH